jgi:hypothetical protein
MATTIAELRESYLALGQRLAPYATAANAVVRGMKDLCEARNRLAADMDVLVQTQPGLAGNELDEKKQLDERVERLKAQFIRIATLRHNIEAEIAPYFGPRLVPHASISPSSPFPDEPDFALARSSPSVHGSSRNVVFGSFRPLPRRIKSTGLGG